MKQPYHFDNSRFCQVSSVLGQPYLFLVELSAFRFVSINYFSKKIISFCYPLSTLFFVFLFLLSTFSFSQIDVINNGLPVSNTNDSVIIMGNVTHQGNGSIANSGSFYISGDWINNNPSGAVFSTGTNGWLHLNGGMQNIGGNTSTHFNNLNLVGTGVKQLNGVNTEIEDTLALNDREFASGDNIVLVMATGTDVITRSNGFVSSTNDGGLSRNTLSTNRYSFPVGSTTGTSLFRPVDITPNSMSANTFKVRMANVNASNEGFDITTKDAELGEINPNYYHRINRINGNSFADITIYYDSVLDGDFTAMTQWGTISQWENLGAVATTSNYGFPGITKNGIYNFSTTPFALSSEVGASVFVPNVFSPNGDGFNDVLRVRGKGIEEMQFIIFNRWGEKVFETTDVNSGWDGTDNGQPMNLSVFVYSVKGKYKNGKFFDEKGNVTLMR
ncbi:MAG: gliding motility-associated C-terminal domain-containing protein [Bacteroidetes bacterium]|nr:gliding motility-associated C-terminal domain-containing protein [Bacteroidota bacterium]